jgi:hypothetical protein
MKFLSLSHIAFGFGLFLQAAALPSGSNEVPHQHGRERVSINSGWKFILME